MKTVVNSSVLIGLSLTEKFHLLRKLFKEIFLPEVVYQEVCVKGEGRPGYLEVEEAVRLGWIKRKEIKNKVAAQFLKETLGEGESEAIVLAKEIGAEIILLDDPKARRAAKLVDLRIMGVVGLLELALKEGEEIDLTKEITKLVKKGFRISKDLLREKEGMQGIE
ncbi:MAG: DUF3368 domain-containing protein [Armatimonadetes bacterium CG07_land_8_20_14_0_80_40_9]|nr:MAG: DUF3368 domain-containing protein [Armatimonadetes bacterium CG07_land_8_20_14_0_80_40_9]